MTDTDRPDPEPLDAEFEPASDAPAKPRGGGAGRVLGFLAAILLGGALGIAGAWLLDLRTAGGDGGETTEIVATLDAVEIRLQAVEHADPNAEAFERIEGLASRVSRLEAAPPLQLGGDAEAVAALAARISVLEAASPATGAPGETVDLAPIEARLTALESALEARPTIPEGAGVDPVILQDFQARIAALEAAGSAAPADMDAGALEALERRVMAAEALARDAHEQAAAAGEAASGPPGADSQADRVLAARAIALVALTDAAQSDMSFEAERAALARVWPGRPELIAMASFARAGAPDLETLRARFPEAAIHDAAGPTRAFFGLIDVRRTGPNEGADGPRALAALARARLAQGDIEGAVSAIERLEGEPAEAARDWLLGAQARLTIQHSLASLRGALAEIAAETEETAP